MKLVVDHADGSQSLLLPAPAANQGFSENGTYRIHAPEGAGWRFLVDDEPLARTTEASGDYWSWSPGFYAGEVTAELQDPAGTSSARYLLDVSPRADKLGRDIFHAMFQAVWEEEPWLVVGSEPATSARGDLGHSQNPLLAFARLRQHLPTFLSSMHEVGKRPLTQLQRTRRLLPPHRVRQADAQTSRAACRSPAALLLLSDSGSARSEDVLFDVPQTEVVLDSPPNRTMLAMTQSLLRRVTSVAKHLEAQSTKDSSSETLTALAPRWPERKRVLRRAEASLEKLLRSSPLCETSRAEVTAAGLNAISAAPHYARAHRGAWRALRTGFSGVATDERLWMSPTWRVYESWTFVRLTQALRDMLPGDWQRRRQGETISWACEARGIAIHFQQRFPRPTQEHEGFRALVRLRIPDIVITRDARNPSLVVLDAKYMSSNQSIVHAMDAAHIYHDTLRWRNQPPDRVLLLVPSGGSTPWLEDPAFQEREGIGVAELNEDSDIASLLKLVL